MYVILIGYIYIFCHCNTFVFKKVHGHKLLHLRSTYVVVELVLTLIFFYCRQNIMISGESWNYYLIFLFFLDLSIKVMITIQGPAHLVLQLLKYQGRVRCWLYDYVCIFLCEWVWQTFFNAAVDFGIVIIGLALAADSI